MWGGCDHIAAIFHHLKPNLKSFPIRFLTKNIGV